MSRRSPPRSPPRTPGAGSVLRWRCIASPSGSRQVRLRRPAVRGGPGSRSAMRSGSPGNPSTPSTGSGSHEQTRERGRRLPPVDDVYLRARGGAPPRGPAGRPGRPGARAPARAGPRGRARLRAWDRSGDVGGAGSQRARCDRRGFLVGCSPSADAGAGGRRAAADAEDRLGRSPAADACGEDGAAGIQQGPGAASADRSVPSAAGGAVAAPAGPGRRSARRARHQSRSGVPAPHRPACARRRSGRVNRQGVSYDVGRVLGGNWRPVFDPQVVHRELEIIKTDLHCNAVRICGLDIARLTTAAEDALAQGLEVWLSPEMWNKSARETLEYIVKAAAAAETLRARWPGRLVFCLGSELTPFLP